MVDILIAGAYRSPIHKRKYIRTRFLFHLPLLPSVMIKNEYWVMGWFLHTMHVNYVPVCMYITVGTDNNQCQLIWTLMSNLGI